MLKEVHKQLSEKQDFKEKFKKDALETQRELWQEVGSVSISNELDQTSGICLLIDYVTKLYLVLIMKKTYKK